MTKAKYISTSIPYVNAAPHLGHALEFVQTDIIARYWRLNGNEVFFLSGTDDNSLKNVLKAEEAGEDVASFVSRHADIFETLLAQLEISNDDFIRTSSDERHLRGAQKLWQSFKPEDITKKVYEGLYCVGCEEFKTEKELVNGHCSEHPNTELQKVSEENYFFKLGNYQEKLLELIESNTLRIIPETRKNEVVAFIKAGLEDLSISRSTARARGWGVPVPGDESQVMYVWVDALSNYITALGYADDTAQFEKFWKNADDSVHAIGKGITRFHAVYWPAFLLSAGIPLPKTLLVHGYVTVNGQKMSKSVGNVVDPAALAEEYGAEAFRYFVAREVSQFEDSDFTNDRFAETYEANLVNGLGNQVARIMKLAETHLTESVPEAIVVLDAGELQTPFSAALDAFNIQAAADLVWEHIGKADAYIQETQPFRLVKSEDPAEKEKGIEIIRKLVRHAAEIAVHLRPILPDTAAKIEAAIRGNRMPESLFPRKIA